VSSCGAVEFSPDGHLLVLSGHGTKKDVAVTTFYSTDTWKELIPQDVQSFETVAQNAAPVTWTADSKRVIIALEDGNMIGAFMVVSAPSLQVEEAWRLPNNVEQDDYTAIAAPAAGTLFVGGPSYNQLRFNDYRTGKTAFRVPLPNCNMLTIALSPDGATVAVGSTNSLTLVDVKTHSIIESIPMPGNVEGLAFNPVTHQLGAVHYDFRGLYGHGAGTEFFRYFNDKDLTTIAKPMVVPGGEYRFVGMCYSADGKSVYLLYNRPDGDTLQSVVLVKDPQTFKIINTYGPIAQEAKSLALSPDGKYLITSTEKQLNIWLLNGQGN
jgi:WD40 repeat protein